MTVGGCYREAGISIRANSSRYRGEERSESSTWVEEILGKQHVALINAAMQLIERRVVLTQPGERDHEREWRNEFSRATLAELVEQFQGSRCSRT